MHSCADALGFADVAERAFRKLLDDVDPFSIHLDRDNGIRADSLQVDAGNA